jgi:hypothetical protein
MRLDSKAFKLSCHALMRDFPEGMLSPGEVALVGAGLGGGFENTSELHIVKFKAAMVTKDHAKWETAIEDKHQHVADSGAWKAVPHAELPCGAKVVSSTWAMKKKPNGVHEL